jgi:hypothetical protein
VDGGLVVGILAVNGFSLEKACSMPSKPYEASRMARCFDNCSVVVSTRLPSPNAYNSANRRSHDGV